MRMAGRTTRAMGIFWPCYNHDYTLFSIAIPTYHYILAIIIMKNQKDKVLSVTVRMKLEIN